MLTGNRQFRISVVEQAPTQQHGIHLKVRAPKTAFDGDFPDACRAENRLGVGVVEQLIIGPHTPTGLTGIVDGA